MHEADIIEIETRRAPAELGRITPQAFTSFSRLNFSANARELRAGAIDVKIITVGSLVVPGRGILKRINCDRAAVDMTSNQFCIDEVFFVIPLVEEIDAGGIGVAIQEVQLWLVRKTIFRC